MAASTTVATSSRFNSSDAVAAGVSTSPAVSRAGPIAPPATIANATRRQSRRSADTSGRPDSPDGATASAAPRYSSPANANGSTSCASTEAAGVDAPNSRAANRQLQTPDRDTPPRYDGAVDGPAGHSLRQLPLQR